MYTNIQLELLVPCYTRNSSLCGTVVLKPLSRIRRKKNLNRRQNGINAGVKFFLEQTF